MQIDFKQTTDSKVARSLGYSKTVAYKSRNAIAFEKSALL